MHDSQNWTHYKLRIKQKYQLYFSLLGRQTDLRAEESENSGINMGMVIGSWPGVRQDENMPGVLGNPTALFCIIFLPPFLRKVGARLRWGKTMQSWDLSAFPVLYQGHGRSMFGALLQQSANGHSELTMEAMWAEQGKKMDHLTAYRTSQVSSQGLHPQQPPSPQALLRLHFSFRCHAALPASHSSPS